MSKSIGKRLRGDYTPMPIENNFNKNRRVNYFELFGKNEQSYIEPTPVFGQRLPPQYQQNQSYTPEYYNSISNIHCTDPRRYIIPNYRKDNWVTDLRRLSEAGHYFDDGFVNGGILAAEKLANVGTGGIYGAAMDIFGKKYSERNEQFLQDAKKISVDPLVKFFEHFW